MLGKILFIPNGLICPISRTPWSGLISRILEYCVCQHTDPGMTLKHRDLTMETTTVEGRRQVEFEGSEEFLDLYDLGRLPLWNLADYGSCQYPRSRCIGERPEHGALELKVFIKKTPGQEISTME